MVSSISKAVVAPNLSLSGATANSVRIAGPNCNKERLDAISMISSLESKLETSKSLFFAVLLGLKTPLISKNTCWKDSILPLRVMTASLPFSIEQLLI